MQSRTTQRHNREQTNGNNTRKTHDIHCKIKIQTKDSLHIQNITTKERHNINTQLNFTAMKHKRKTLNSSTKEQHIL